MAENIPMMTADIGGIIALVVFAFWILGGLAKGLGKVFQTFKGKDDMAHRTDEYHQEVFDDDLSKYDQPSPYQAPTKPAKPKKRESALEDFLKDLHAGIMDEEEDDDPPPIRRKKESVPNPLPVATAAAATTMAASQQESWQQRTPPPIKNKGLSPAQIEMQRLQQIKYRELQASKNITPAQIEAQRYEISTSEEEVYEPFEWRIRDMRKAFIMKEILSAPRCKQSLPQGRSITHQQPN